MGYIVRMPKMGLEMEEGEVVAWNFDEGDRVQKGEAIAVVESDKASNEVDVREDGVLRRIIVSEGTRVEVSEPIGIVAGPDEDISSFESELPDTVDLSLGGEGETDQSSASSAMVDDRATQSTDAPDITTEIRATPKAEQLIQDQDIDVEGVTGTGPQGTITENDVLDHVRERADSQTAIQRSTDDFQASPGARRLASKQNIDLNDVKPTGPQGTIIESDVRNYQSGSAGDSRDAGGTAVRATPGAKQLATHRNIELTSVVGTGPQGTITERDIEEYKEETAAEAGTTRTVREVQSQSGIQKTVASRMSESHQNAPHVTLNRSFDARRMQTIKEVASTEGIEISLTDLLLSALGAELAATPEFNALYEDGEYKLIEEVNIGVAIDVEDGLLTPVIPEVPSKSIESVADVRAERTKRALSGEFSMDDLSGGTFTVTNLGMFGIDDFDPIINPPEVAILGVGRIRDDGTMTLSLSFDHRVVNGADAARFLDSLINRLTDTGALISHFESKLLSE